MEDIRSKKFWQHIGLATVGMLLFAMGINLFIVPADLYNGGLLGISQILRTLLVRYLHWFSGTTDIAGVINLLLNVPLFILAYISISKSFFARTLICVVSQTVFLSFIPIPTTPIVSDCLTASIIGGIMAGSGIGIALRSGGSSGGMDIVGMYFTKKYKDFSVGKVSLVVNCMVYGICGILFGGQYFDDRQSSCSKYKCRSYDFYKRSTGTDCGMYCSGVSPGCNLVGSKGRLYRRKDIYGYDDSFQI